MLQPLLDERTKPEAKTNKVSLAAGIGLSLAGAAVLGHEYFDLLFTARNMGAALLVAGGAVGAHGAGWLRRPDKGAPGSGSPNASPSTSYSFRLLNPSTRFRGAAQALDKLCTGSSAKFPEEVEELIQRAREQEEQQKQAALESRAAALAARVKGALSPPSSAAPSAPTTSQPATEPVAATPVSATELLQQLTPRLFVLEYVDPPSAPRAAAPGAGARERKSRAERFGEEVSLLLSIASRHDQVLLCLTSPGGRVSEYGLAASHLLRLKQAGLHTTVAVDTIAASGGYMMAVCADRIVAAPFAFIGSIGVVAEVPNVSRLLGRADVDYLTFTAGKYKRTVTVFSPNTDEGKAKFQADIEKIHQAFKAHIASNREGGSLDVEQVATGEAWLAAEAQRYGLVDELATSHDIILRKAAEGFDVVELSRKPPARTLHSLFDRLIAVAAAAEQAAYGALNLVLPGAVAAADGAAVARGAWGSVAGASHGLEAAPSGRSAIDALDSAARLPAASAAGRASARSS